MAVSPNESASNNFVQFNAEPRSRFQGPCASIRRPREFTYYSFDENRAFHPDARSLKWYYPPEIGVDLSSGFETFKAHDNTKDEHLTALLKSIKLHEEKTGEKTKANFITWRGLLVKLFTTPYSWEDSFELNATLFDGTIFFEENHAYKTMMEIQRASRIKNCQINQDVMCYWGYKFETLSTLPAPWAECSREFIESRPTAPVSNIDQYCSIVNTAIGGTPIVIGGEVDAVWDAKPVTLGAPVNWVELKTSKTRRNMSDSAIFYDKAKRFWLQSFLLGVPKVIVGFRDKKGILESVEEFSVEHLAQMPPPRTGKWEPNVLINFGDALLKWLKEHITDEGVWQIHKPPHSDYITLRQVEKVGHGEILSEEFINWRIKLHINQKNPEPPKTDPEDTTQEQS